MQMIIKPSDDVFDTVTIDLNKVVTMDLIFICMTGV